MNDTDKSKEQLLNELNHMRQHLAKLEMQEEDRKRREEALRESEERLRVISEASLEGVAVSEGGFVIAENPRLAEILGYEPGEIVGRPVWEFVAPEDRDFVVENIRKGYNRSYEHKAVRKDGSIIVVEASGKNVSYRGRPARITIIRDITERKQTEQQLRILVRAIEQSANIIIITDAAGDIEYVNPKFSQLTGYTSEEIIGKNPRILKTGTVPLEEFRRMWRVVTSGKEWRGEFCNRKKNEEWYWESASISPVKDEEGNITHFLAVKEDITERKRAEEAERQQRILVEALHDTATVLTSTLNSDVVMAHILEIVGRVVPHDAANIMLIEGDIGRMAYWRGYPKDQEAFLSDFCLPLKTSLLHEMLTTRAPLLITDTAANPDWVSVPESAWVRSYTAAPIQAYGQVIGFLSLDSATPGFFTAVHTERLQAFADQAAIAIENAQLYDQIRRHANELEERVAQRTMELAQKQALLGTILDTMGEGVVYLEDDQAVYANKPFARLTGYGVEEVFGQKLDFLMDFIKTDNDDDIESLSSEIRGAIEHGDTWRNELRYIRKDGNVVDASVTATPVIGSDGKFIGSVALVRDISKEKFLQAQKDRFIADASHELRTPVSNLKLHLYLLSKQPEKSTEYLNILEEEVNRLQALVEDLLDVSRFERGMFAMTRQKTILQKLITEVVKAQQLRAESKDINLTIDLPAKPVHAFIDPKRISQVITNLVSNAINYTPDSGQVSVQMTADQESVVIRVQDTGRGIAPEFLPHVFEPFARAPESEESIKGTGLGLAIVKEIVDMHGGQISVQSRPGLGSIFSIELALLNDSQN